MGNSNNKDGFVDMFIETTKAVYVAGEYVQGTVHINCKSARSYRKLSVRLIGSENVRWSEGSGKNRRTYSNHRDTYSSGFDLAVFSSGKIGGGHYSFPFSMLLPSGLTGSYFENDSNYIRYALTAQLTPSDGECTLQQFPKYLNLNEPVRAPYGPTFKEQISAPQCCGCCKQYGVIKVNMSCDKNSVTSGEQINVQGLVDNGGGKIELKDCQVSFVDSRVRISSGGAVRNWAFNEVPLHALPNIVNAGQSQNFSFKANVPSNLTQSTAIGSIVARYQCLVFSCNMGCCASSPTVSILMVFASTTPALEQQPNIPPPVGWNPTVAPEVVYTTMVPYVYTPLPQIPLTNRENSGNTGNVGNLQAMGQMQMEMNQQQMYPQQQQYGQQGGYGNQGDGYNQPQYGTTDNMENTNEGFKANF